MRVLVCGSRDWDDDLSYVVLRGLYAAGHHHVLIEGGADGADRQARTFARMNGLTHEQYPADWQAQGRAAGPIRNQQMLDEGKPDLVLAFVNKPLAESRGTADMVRRAVKAMVPTYVIARVNAQETDQ